MMPLSATEPIGRTEHIERNQDPRQWHLVAGRPYAAQVGTGKSPPLVSPNVRSRTENRRSRTAATGSLRADRSVDLRCWRQLFEPNGIEANSRYPRAGLAMSWHARRSRTGGIAERRFKPAFRAGLLKSCVLEFFQGARLDLDRRRLGRELPLHLREGVEATALLLGGHVDHVDLEQSGQRE